MHCSTDLRPAWVNSGAITSLPIAILCYFVPPSSQDANIRIAVGDFALGDLVCKQVLTSVQICVHNQRDWEIMKADRASRLFVSCVSWCAPPPVHPTPLNLMKAAELEVVLACRDRPALGGLIPVLLHSLPTPKPHSGFLSAHADQL